MALEIHLIGEISGSRVVEKTSWSTGRNISHPGEEARQGGFSIG